MRIALTGPDGDGGSLGEGLRALGIETLSFPLLGANPPEDRSSLEAFLARPPEEYDCIVFSSPRAVDAIAALRDGSPVDPHWFTTKLCMAVGPETARRADEAGYRVKVEGELGGAAGLLAALDRCDHFRFEAGSRVLLPVSDRARPELADGLRARGATVDEVVVYRVATVPGVRTRVEELLTSGADAIVLASPSAVAALAEGLPGGSRPVPPLVALGSTTADAMRKRDLSVAGAATRPTPHGLWCVMKELGMTESSGFPAVRPRRLRRSEGMRALVRETRLTPDCLVAPMFIAASVGGNGVRAPVPSMPGVERLSVSASVEDAAELARRGVRTVLLFGIPSEKTPDGSSAWDEGGPVCRAITLIKREVPQLSVWADVCLCEYTDHGHCGRLAADGSVDNDATLPLLARAAVAYARAGADAVAPSDMMDGRVRAIRGALDRESLTDTAIVSYAVKYASAFYGPFRDAAGSAPKQGDRRGYQMDPANAREALREAALDEAEGADILMVKPALPCLDIVRRVRDATHLPVAAYQVSGEWAMLQAAAEKGWVDRDRALLETLTAIRRAGADVIVTYGAADAARLLA